MTRKLLQTRIADSLEKLDEEQLRTTYLLLQEMMKQKKQSDVCINREEADKKIKQGLQELKEGKGTDFNVFLNELKADYGSPT